MNIQWFPGHMTKSLRMMQEQMSGVDAVLYVLDARAVASCFNPAFDELIGEKKVIYLLNKSDLADERITKTWVKHFQVAGKHSLTICGTHANDCKYIVSKLEQVLSEKIARLKQKGATHILRAMVIGIPNSGKSTIINSLCIGKRAKTGDKAGVTRAKQWIKVTPYLELLDTPGTLYPAFENQTIARHLAFVGSINDDILDKEELCVCLVETLMRIAPQNLCERYHLTQLHDQPSGNVEAICAARGLLQSKGNYDYARCAAMVIDDFRKARLGRISLDRCEE